jgi:hypothetical protein
MSELAVHRTNLEPVSLRSTPELPARHPAVDALVT